MMQHVLDMGDESLKPQEGNIGTDATPLATHQPIHLDDVNISEEVKKTGIWHHLNSQPTLSASSATTTTPAYSDISQPRHRSVISLTCQLWMTVFTSCCI